MEEQAEKTIREGQGVIVWCGYRKAWTLPGGATTTDKVHATMAALWINSNALTYRKK